MSALIHNLAQWGVGFGVVFLGAAAFTLLAAFCVTPECEPAREAVGFLVFVGAIIGALTWGMWSIGGWLLP